MLEVFPEQIKDSGEVPLSCTVPPAPGSGRPQAVEEALAYRAAYERRLARTGRTLVGRCISAEKIPDVIERFFAIAEGQGRQGVSLPGTMTDAAMDVRAYYEEAAIELAGHVPAARSADAWFFTQTLTGRLLLAVQKKLRDDGEPSDVWFGIAAAAYVAARSG